MSNVLINPYLVVPSGPSLSFGSWTTTLDIATIVIPGGASVGDLAVLVDGSTDATTTIPTDVTPSGFTQVATNSIVGASRGSRLSVSYKVLEIGDLGATITGMDSGVGDDAKTLLVVASTVAITSVVVSTPNSDASVANIAAQTIAAGAGTAPLVAIGSHIASGSPGTTMSPSAGGQQDLDSGAALDSRTEFKIYNASQANVTWDPDDPGNRNIAISFFIEAS